MVVWCCYCVTANVTWPKVNWNSFCCSLRSRSSAASTQTSPPSSLLELFSGQWLVCHRVWELFWKQCHQSCPPLTPAASPFTWLWVWQRSPLCWRGRRGFWTGAGWQVRNEQPQLSDTFDLCLLSNEFCPCSLQLCNKKWTSLLSVLFFFFCHYKFMKCVFTDQCEYFEKWFILDQTSYFSGQEGAISYLRVARVEFSSTQKKLFCNFEFSLKSVIWLPEMMHDSALEVDQIKDLPQAFK